MINDRQATTGQPDAVPSGNARMTTNNPTQDGVHVTGHAEVDSGWTTDSGQRRTADLLRYVPPVAALGTAFVLQIVVVADLLGGTLADRFNSGWAYIPAVLFGLAVATSLEGGAAYLMDLYDRHLLARDSTLWLRVLMVVYVAGSAAAIHWWADTRGLPTIMSWLLAAMSASALFLWSRGSRWRNREAMRAAGQIDPALPRLPMASKVLHPVRSLVTLWLISWEPVPTTTAARARFQTWKDRRAGRLDVQDLAVQQAVFLAEGRLAVRRIEVERELSARQAAALSVAEQIRTEADLYAQQVRTAADEYAANVRTDSEHVSADAVRRREEAYSEADRILSAARKKADTLTAVRTDTNPNGRADRAPDTDRAVRLVVSNGAKRTPGGAHPEVSVEQLADSLGERFPDTVPGRPTAITHLKQVYGSCSNDRAREAIRILSARRESATRTTESGSSDDKERAWAGVGT